MTDGITGDEWFAPFVGEGDGQADRIETMSQFESAEKFGEAYFESLNRDWRSDIIGDELLSEDQANRFATVADLAKSYRNVQAQVDKGFQAPTPPGEGATEDDIKHFHEQIGVPIEAKGYLENLPDGVVVGEDDAEAMLSAMEALHGVHAPPEVAHALIGWYNGWTEEQQTAVAEADGLDRKETEDQLREAWGSDYRTNINVVGKTLESQFGKEAAEILMNARGPDGAAIMNNPAIMAGFAQIGRTIDPLVQIIPSGGDAEQTLHDEIAEIEKFMRTNRTEYNKDEKMQARLRELYDIRANLEESGRQATG